VLSLAAALRAENVAITAIDSSARAIQCTMENAALNGIRNLRAKLDASAQIDEPGTYDVVLANPPYYSNYRIAEIFLKGSPPGVETRRPRALRDQEHNLVRRKHAQALRANPSHPLPRLHGDDRHPAVDLSQELRVQRQEPIRVLSPPLGEVGRGSGRVGGSV
jgi:hypothetical protein